MVDKRDPRPEGSAETVEELNKVLTELFERANVDLASDARYELSVEIDYADELVPKEKADSCIVLLTSLRWRGRMLLQAQAAGCYEWRHLLGFYLGGDASRAYSEALDFALSKLDKDVRKATQMVSRYREARRASGVGLE